MVGWVVRVQHTQTKYMATQIQVHGFGSWRGVERGGKGICIRDTREGGREVEWSGV